jgi:hypothetical protein
MVKDHLNWPNMVVGLVHLLIRQWENAIEEFELNVSLSPSSLRQTLRGCPERED